MRLDSVDRRRFVRMVDKLVKIRIRDHFLVSSPLGGDLERIELREVMTCLLAVRTFVAGGAGPIVESTLDQVTNWRPVTSLLGLLPDADHRPGFIGLPVTDCF